MQPSPFSSLPVSVHAFSLALLLAYSPTLCDFPWPPSSGLVNLPGKPAYIYTLIWLELAHLTSGEITHQLVL